MRHLGNLLIYLITWSSTFAFCFTFFRLKIQSYWGRIVASIIIMSEAGYWIHIYHLAPWVYLIQVSLCFLCLTFVIRLNWLHALVMAIFIYAFTVFILVLINLLLVSMHWDRFSFDFKEITAQQRLQLSFVYLLFIFIFNKFRLGFTFISATGSVRWITLSVWIKMVIMIGICCIAVKNLTLFVWEQLNVVDYYAVLFLPAIILLLFYRKEIKE